MAILPLTRIFVQRQDLCQSLCPVGRSAWCTFVTFSSPTFPLFVIGLDIARPCRRRPRHAGRTDRGRATSARADTALLYVLCVVARGALIDRDCALVQRAPPLRQHGKACLETLDAVAGSSAFTSHARRSDGLLAKISSLPRDEYQVAAGCFQSESLELVLSIDCSYHEYDMGTSRGRRLRSPSSLPLSRRSL